MDRESSSPNAVGHAKGTDMKDNLIIVIILCLHTGNKDPTQTSYDVMKGHEDYTHDLSLVFELRS